MISTASWKSGAFTTSHRICGRNERAAELAGFQRVGLRPGESRRITFTPPYTAQVLWYWHESHRKFVIQPGTLKLMIGGSSADIHLNAEVLLNPCSDDQLGGPETLTAVAVASAIH
ncbi:MAG: fibronectin type III-like domain-contianing protein [Phycisphaerae bacterium]